MILEVVVGFVVVVLLVLLVAYVVSVYNQLIELIRRVDQSKRNIDVLLRQRQSELSKLIDAASKVMVHERDVLVTLTEARERAERASTPGEEAAADQAIRNALALFRARVEAYPELRSQTNMLQFQHRISDLESQIAGRREFYNEAVTRYNTRIQQFPYLVLARLFEFAPRELFAASEAELRDVDVGARFEARISE
ncbi:LemA family protein [Natronorarus salvus]|uniref:LemA family protein n=1 Tax=Natronorarus salvus TaxID=3117733 RepID=UPI002F26A82A